MLELKRISVGYTGRYLIRNVDLTFSPGKIYALLGRNGSGKSGILKLCAGQEPTSNGNVIMDGKLLNDMPFSEINRKIGYLPQECRAITMSARKLVGRSIPGKNGIGESKLEHKRKVYSCLSALRAAGLGHLPMNRLSRGERRRVYLAALLAQDPQVFLLDDPFSNLDVESKAIVVELLQDLRNRGKTVIIALHDLDLAMQYADEIVLLDLGKEVHTGTPEQIRQKGLLDTVFRTSALRQIN